LLHRKFNCILNDTELKYAEI